MQQNHSGAGIRSLSFVIKKAISTENIDLKFWAEKTLQLLKLRRFLSGEFLFE